MGNGQYVNRQPATSDIGFGLALGTSKRLYCTHKAEELTQPHELHRARITQSWDRDTREE